MIILGSGDPEYENFFRANGASLSLIRLDVYVGFNESLAHQIYAAGRSYS